MKITWMFFPRSQPPVKLEIVYEPRLDKFNKSGILHVEKNFAIVNWETFKIFDKGSTKDKKKAFASLEHYEHCSQVQDLYLLDNINNLS